MGVLGASEVKKAMYSYMRKLQILKDKLALAAGISAPSERVRAIHSLIDEYLIPVGTTQTVSLLEKQFRQVPKDFLIRNAVADLSRAILRRGLYTSHDSPIVDNTRQLEEHEITMIVLDMSRLK